MINRQHAPLVVRLPRGSWGVCETSIARYGEVRVRLQILPPDISRRERVLWRLLHVWPAAGFLAGVVCAAVLAGPLGPAASIAVGAGLWIFPLVGIWIAAGPLIARVHDRWATSTGGADDAQVDALHAVARHLDAVEAAHEAGDLDDAAFQAAWRDAYLTAEVR